MGAEHSQQQRSDSSDVSGQSGHDQNGMASTMSFDSTNSKRPPSRQNSGASTRQSSQQESNSPTSLEIERPVSPPLSVCYDSDLPYISYTDRPIGDSPKIRNKAQTALRGSGRNCRKSYPIAAKPKRPQSTSNHNIVIVKPGAKDNDVDIDPDLGRLRSIPMFLPVMRATVTVPSSTREPEVLERLQSPHLQHICSRMQAHYNLCATHVATEQNEIIDKTKAVNNTVTTLFASFVDMQRTYASYAEQFSKIRQISKQLSRCNALLNDNIESLEDINNFLQVEDRLEPFVWRTGDVASSAAGRKVGSSSHRT